jgi:hypothetical protein
MHDVEPAGHPQTGLPRPSRTQATPLSQQNRSHGVVPRGQQASHGPLENAQKSPLFGQQCEPQGARPAGQPHVLVEGSTHATPAGQQLVPHGVVPEPQATRAWPRNGRSTVAAAPPAMATPAIFNRPRREVPPAKLLDRSSNRSLMPSPIWVVRHYAYSQEAFRSKRNFLVNGLRRYPEHHSWVR